MKSIILIVLSSILIAVLAFKFPRVDFKTDSPEGIQFQKSSWNDILVLAKKERKLIFLDIYATWCGPCKKLKTKTFSDKEVGVFYNSNFVNVSLDGETGEGLELARKYNINQYPSLLFINSEGNVEATSIGYHNPNEFIKLGKSAINK